MWFVGALLGLVLGGLVLGDSGFLVGALAGGFAANFLKTRLVPTQQDELESRVAVLEEDVRRLRHEVERLRGGGAPAAMEDVVAEPIPAASVPQSAPAPAFAALPEPALDTVAISPPAPRPQPDRPEDEGRAQPIEVPGWLSRLSAGNPLAKIGVVLLFFGVASGLKLAIEHGFFPLWLRLALVGVAGMGLITFGFRKAREATHRGFGLALQGGGFAVLYLTGYFMLARYGMLSEGPAFVLFAVLGVACARRARHFRRFSGTGSGGRAQRYAAALVLLFCAAQRLRSGGELVQGVAFAQYRGLRADFADRHGLGCGPLSAQSLSRHPGVCGALPGGLLGDARRDCASAGARAGGLA